jgi:hypothetical protein
VVTPADPRVWVERQSDRDFADFISRCHFRPAKRHITVYPVGGICPPDHAHGESQGCYTHGCRCDDCRRTNTEYSYWRAQMIRAGRGPVRVVDARGTRRRLEALMALGWSAGELGRRTGTTYQAVNLWRTKALVAPATAAKVAALFDEMWDQRPEPSNRGERVAVSKTLSFARRNGFVPPMAWDDIDTDEQPPVPDADLGVDEAAVALAIAGVPVDLRPADRRAAVRALHAARWNDIQIANQLHCAPMTVLRIRKELGLPEVFGQTERRPRPSSTREAA